MSEIDFPAHVILAMFVAFVVLPVTGVYSMIVYQRRQQFRQSKDKVRQDEPSLEDDIDLLVSMNSPFVDDAKALRRAQTERCPNCSE